MAQTEARKKYLREYYQKHKNHLYILQKKRPSKQPEARKKYDKKYISKVGLPYILFKGQSGRIRCALAESRRAFPVPLLIGCSREFLVKYLTTKFKPGMTWENWGTWHIDHIIPCCHFDLTDPIQQQFCFNYTNLQPLWANEHMAKSVGDRAQANIK